MVKPRTFKYIWLCVLLLAPLAMRAQVMDTGHKVDTLSGAERLSLRSNAVDWLLLVPNIGIEYDLGSTNWNRWSVGLNLRYNWQTSHTYKPGLVYNVAEARLEVRNYYRIRVFDGQFVEPKKHIWERVVSPRRAESKHPTTTYYRGAFVAYNNYSLKFGTEGKQGNAIIGGVMWGMIKPMYEFSNGNSLDLEFAASAGVAYAKYDTYTHDRMDDCYPITATGKTTIMPVINELRVGFVYRFGSYPITKKYRWRYDVDLEYQERMDSTIRATRNAIAAKQLSDSLYESISKVFWDRYNELAKKNKARAEKQSAADKKAAEAKKAADKKAAEAKKAADKQAAEEKKKADKEAKKAAAAEEKEKKKAAKAGADASAAPAAPAAGVSPVGTDAPAGTAAPAEQPATVPAASASGSDTPPAEQPAPAETPAAPAEQPATTPAASPADQNEEANEE